MQSSTVKGIVEAQKYLFDTLWNLGIPAIEKITEIEKGIVHEFIHTMSDPNEIQKIAFNAIQLAKQEILITFPTDSSFHILEQLGIMKILNEISSTNTDIRIKILRPANVILSTLKKEDSESLDGYNNNIEIRDFKQPLQSKISLLIVDRKYSLVTEIKETNDEKLEMEARNHKHHFKSQLLKTGLATYSNSKATVISYTSIFETLWSHVDLYEQLGESNKKLELSINQLKAHDEAQNIFINTAAHELRNPIQPILGLSQVLRSHKRNIKPDELLDAIVRNAIRLQHLTEDILDVTRIESKALKLNKEMINLKDIIAPIIQDYSKAYFI
jgi:two-component system, OmpR family, sensor histidine kinase VicK